MLRISIYGLNDLDRIKLPNNIFYKLSFYILYIILLKNTILKNIKPNLKPNKQSHILINFCFRHLIPISLLITDNTLKFLLNLITYIFIKFQYIF